jgi:acetylornithine/N-succinyldiaminopimelate aminotransferase
MMAEITDNPAYKVGLPSYNEVLRLPFYDSKNVRSIELTEQKLRQHIDENKNEIAAFMFELVQGEGGFKQAPREYFLPLFQLCRENNIAIWADEVQTFCRTGEFFAFESLDLGDYIDVCTIAKTAQVAANLFTKEYNPQPGLIAGTFANSSSALAAGFEILDFLEREGYMGKSGKIEKVHAMFTQMLRELAEGSCRGLLSDVGGKGLMVAVTPFDGSKEKMGELLKVLFNNGLMCFGCGHGPYRLRFLIPAVITETDIQLAGRIIEKSLLEMK